MSQAREAGPAVESGYLHTGAVRLQYFTRGQGPQPILFVHGYQASAPVWRLVQEAMDPQRFRTIALNNRGAGGSDRTPRQDDYRVESFAADLAAAVDALGLRDFTLVGHSLGGATVTQYALAHQRLLKALVLVNPIPLDHRAGTIPVAATEHERAAMAAAAAEERANAPEELLRVLDAEMAQVPAERIAGGRASMGTLRLRERLRELRLPVLVMGGDRDYVAGVGNILGEYLALPAETRSLHLIHGAGHSPIVGVPRECAAVLERFLAGAGAPRT
jgi:branched-chain amino acid transport system permease protein